MSEITALPPASDPRWKNLVTGNMSKPLAMLALKIMMTRILNSTKADPSPANVDKNIQEVRSFFEKNMQLAQQDLATIFG